MRRRGYSETIIRLLEYVEERDPALNVGRFGRDCASVAIRDGLIVRTPWTDGIFVYVLTDEGRELLEGSR